MLRTGSSRESDGVMPAYRAPWFLPGGHLQTIFPALFRKFSVVANRRERTDTPDGDFLDLDWGEIGSRKLAIICHGLEGGSREHYVQGMARAVMEAGWDALCWNFRGCSEEMNRSLRSYHSGATDDLETVLDSVLRLGRYDRIDLIGFSLGGNLILKYAGDSEAAARVNSVCAFSVPCDLAASSTQLAKRSNSVYMKRFLNSLARKVKVKDEMYPGKLDMTGLDGMSTFAEFDDRFTAPLNGFDSAEDYWAKCSCISVLRSIAVPTLLVNALNDPFLPEECYPFSESANNPNFRLEAPAKGGHVGFVEFNEEGLYWSEKRAVSFLKEQENLVTT